MNRSHLSSPPQFFRQYEHEFICRGGSVPIEPFGFEPGDLTIRRYSTRRARNFGFMVAIAATVAFGLVIALGSWYGINAACDWLKASGR